MIFLIILPITITVLAIFGSIIISNWYNSLIEDAPYIKFSAFLSFYNINPGRWSLRDDYVGCEMEKNSCYLNWVSYSNLECDFSFFNFHLFDFYKYKKWMHKRKKQKQDTNKAKITAAMIVSVQSDINRTHIEESYFRKALEEKMRKDLGI